MKVKAADTIIEVGGIRIGPGLTKQQAENLYGLGQKRFCRWFTAIHKCQNSKLFRMLYSPPHFEPQI